MSGKLRQRILPFRIEMTNEPLIARAGLVLPYETARSLRLPKVIDRELPGPGSGHSYKPSQFVIPLVLMIHGGGKELEDLREIKGEVSLRKLLEMNELAASCTVGDWLRMMGKDGRTEYTLDVDATIIEAEKAKTGWTYQKMSVQTLVGAIQTKKTGATLRRSPVFSH